MSLDASPLDASPRPVPQIAGAVEHSRRRSSLLAWARRNALDIGIVAGLMLVVGLLHANGMTTYPGRFDDEGTYMSQAWAVLARFDLAHYTYWYDHPPLGWLILAAHSLLTGALERAPYGVAAGREAMLIANLASSALLYGLGRRLRIGRPFAALAVLLFGLSPLAVFYHRMVLLDNIAMPFLLGAFVLLASPRKKLLAHVLAAVSMAIAVLIRETYVLFLIPAVMLYWKQTDPSIRRYSLALTSVTFGGIVLLYPAFALLRGELLPGDGKVSLLGAISWQLFDRAGSGSVFDPTSPAGHTVSGWVFHDPWILVVGLTASVVSLFLPRFRFLGVAAAVQVLMMLRPGYLPNMYVVAVLPFFALAVGGVADAAWRLVPPLGPGFQRASRVVVAGAVAALVVGLAPGYWVGAARAMESDGDRPFREAQEWLSQNLEPADIVLLDSALWLDVVRDGHPENRAVWYYKIDSDPGLELPGTGDWKTVDYVVTSEVMRNTTYDLPNVEAAMAHGTPVAVFGDGPDRVEILEVRS